MKSASLWRLATVGASGAAVFQLSGCQNELYAIAVQGTSLSIQSVIFATIASFAQITSTLLAS